jgi:ferritin-like metal-binding protein YciE
MQALAAEARKMTKVGVSAVRDAGLIASVQRLLHYRIAGYGTVAAYARALGETYHAGALAGCSDRDKRFDEQLTELAESVINPLAERQETSENA